MLVLSRKEREKIRIGTGANLIVIEVLEIGKSRVRIGVTAPGMVVTRPDGGQERERDFDQQQEG